ncbi:MAG: hypothetical protein LIO69_04150 [Oscillospiraceae bacterium]|nr:hypothetical protein [Oscillospiraceae bacterium]
MDNTQSKSKSPSKLIGRIILILTLIILILFLILSSYIGGQDKAMEKYFSSVCAGDLKSNAKAIGMDYDPNDAEKAEYKAAARAYFSEKDEFADLSETDIISYNVNITDRAVISPTVWVCTADVSFYSGEMSLVMKNVEAALIYDGGWKCEDILLLNNLQSPSEVD